MLICPVNSRLQPIPITGESKTHSRSNVIAAQWVGRWTLLGGKGGSLVQIRKLWGRVLIGALVNAKIAKKGSYDMPLQFARSLQTKIRSKMKEGQRPKSER